MLVRSYHVHQLAAPLSYPRLLALRSYVQRGRSVGNVKVVSLLSHPCGKMECAKSEMKLRSATMSYPKFDFGFHIPLPYPSRPRVQGKTKLTDAVISAVVPILVRQVHLWKYLSGPKVSPALKAVGNGAKGWNIIYHVKAESPTQLPAARYRPHGQVADILRPCPYRRWVRYGTRSFSVVV